MSGILETSLRWSSSTVGKRARWRLLVSCGADGIENHFIFEVHVIEPVIVHVAAEVGVLADISAKSSQELNHEHLRAVDSCVREDIINTWQIVLTGGIADGRCA